MRIHRCQFKLRNVLKRLEARALRRTCKLLSGGGLVAEALLVTVGGVPDEDEIGEPE
jgi:hypothetical protein